MSWLERNFNTLVTLFISVIVAGLIGYFSAVLAIRRDLAAENEKVTILETKINDVVIPELKRLDVYNDRIYKLELSIIKVDVQSTMIMQLERDIVWPRLEVRRRKQH